MYYTGIGSRSTPKSVCNSFTEIAKVLHKYGFILRSGYAEGADIAFEKGAYIRKEIYLPWHGFNGAPDYHPYYVVNSRKAMEIAAQHHPAWNRCSPAARKLHARNSHQILGLNLNNPSLFVLCWTPEGSGRGGTGQALRIAKNYNIPIFDFGSNFVRVLDEFENFINKMDIDKLKKGFVEDVQEKEIEPDQHPDDLDSWDPNDFSLGEY